MINGAAFRVVSTVVDKVFMQVLKGVLPDENLGLMLFASNTCFELVKMFRMLLETI